MSYTVNKGVYGISFPRRYTSDSGSKLAFNLLKLPTAVKLPSIPAFDYAKYAAPSFAALAIAVLLLQSAGETPSPITPSDTPAVPKVQTASVQLTRSRPSALRQGDQTAPSNNPPSKSSSSSASSSSLNVWQPNDVKNGTGVVVSAPPLPEQMTLPTHGGGGAGSGAAPVSVPPVADAPAMPVVDPLPMPSAPPVSSIDPPADTMPQSSPVKVILPPAQINADPNPLLVNLGL